jgi:hypothetical protein
MKSHEVLFCFSPEHSEKVIGSKLRNGSKFIAKTGVTKSQRAAQIPLTKKYCVRNIPSGFPGEPTAFKGICALVSVISGYYLTVYHEENTENSDIRKNAIIVQKFYLASRKLKCNIVAGGKFLLAKVHELQRQYQELEGRHHKMCDILPILAKHYDSQIHVFSCVDPTTCDFSYPIEWNYKSRPIYIYQDFEDMTKANPIAHCYIIHNLRGWYNATKIFCFACKQSFGGNYYDHVCKSKLIQTCFSCQKTAYIDEMYFNMKTVEDFCGGFPPQPWPDSTSEGRSERMCQKCNIVPPSNECKHNCIGWKCLECPIGHTRFSSSFKTPQAVKDDHDCFNQYCGTCRVKYDVRSGWHYCEIVKPNFDKVNNEHPRIALLVSEIIDESSWNCLDCCSVVDSCEKHQANSPVTMNSCEPIIYSLFYEHKVRGNFKRKIFFHKDLLNVLPNIDTLDQFEIDLSELLPEDIKQSPLPLKPKTANFGHPKKKLRTIPLLSARNLDVTDLLLSYLIHSKTLEQSVILVLGDEMVRKQH